ncbi:MAG: hypothetical protein R3C11_16355 [Planctomycetaceae bacterium]
MSDDEGRPETPEPEPAAGEDPGQQDEMRLYLHEGDSWDAAVKHGWEKEYCYAKNPGEDFFHLILSGEIYVHKGNEKFCLNCALRHGVVTRDRLHWQHH